MKGCVQVYTGDGKGKTTASLGLALRAYGADLRVFIGQFAKGTAGSEHKTLAALKDRITIKQYGQPGFIYDKPTARDRKAAKHGWAEVKENIYSNKYDVVILDEINIALYYKLIPLKEILSLIDNKPKQVELVFTGRNAPQGLIRKADLVTEMKEIKHYHLKGVRARKGIEK